MDRTRVEYEVTEALLLDALSATAERDPTTRRRLVRMWCNRALYSTLLIGLLTWISFDGPIPPILTGSLAVGVAIGLLAAFPTRGKVRRLIRGHVAEGLRGDPGYQQLLGWRTIEVTTDRLVLRTEYAEFRFDWHSAVRAFATAALFVMTFPGPITVTLPREAFVHDSDFEDFARAIRRRARAAGGLPDDRSDD
jgi:hypothetical protein